MVLSQLVETSSTPEIWLKLIVSTRQEFIRLNESSVILITGVATLEWQFYFRV